jgi:hypothetical protein
MRRCESPECNNQAKEPDWCFDCSNKGEVALINMVKREERNRILDIIMARRVEVAGNPRLWNEVNTILDLIKKP